MFLTQNCPRCQQSIHFEPDTYVQCPHCGEMLKYIKGRLELY